MTICFVRHGELEQPYDSYDALSLTQLDALATQQADPPINLEGIHVVSWLSNVVRRAETLKVYCATSKRAAETSEVILDQAGRHEKPTTTELLNEIWFTPSKLVDDEDFKTSGMRAIRSNLFDAILSGSKAAENIEAIFTRIKKLDELLSGLGVDCALCVTHGFYMRFLELYFKDGITDSSQMTKDLIRKKPNRPNFRGFKVDR
jgi:broad specificity phosphatase PhoE